MKVLAIIPARGGSKGVLKKNSKLLGGKPLIQYTIESAISSKMISKIALSTDDEEIITFAKQFEPLIDVPYKRPAYLATDSSQSIEVVMHLVEHLKSKGENYDAICLLQPTTPFRQSGFIDASISEFLKSKSDSLISVLKVPHQYNPHWTFIKNESGLLNTAIGDSEIIPRRQELPDAYFRDGSIYLTKTAVILSGSFYGKSIAFIESDPSMYVNIDTQEDWEIAESMLKIEESK